MRRFFFDVASRRSIQYDFKGFDFQREQEAHELAELIAIDVAMTDEAETPGREVQVRDIAGRKLFRVPIAA